MEFNPTEIEKPTFESPSVHSYLSILQAVIARMATNSSSCKTWCITIVSAILVVVADKAKPEYVWIAVIPTILFFGLDAYYLGLERLFRDQYNAFIRKLHLNTASIDDVFIVNPGVGPVKVVLAAFRSVASVSVFPFYLVLIGMVELARRLIL